MSLNVSEFGLLRSEATARRGRLASPEVLGRGSGRCTALHSCKSQCTALSRRAKPRYGLPSEASEYVAVCNYQVLLNGSFRGVQS